MPDDAADAGELESLAAALGSIVKRIDAREEAGAAERYAQRPSRLVGLPAEPNRVRVLRTLTEVGLLLPQAKVLVDLGLIEPYAGMTSPRGPRYRVIDAGLDVIVWGRLQLGRRGVHLMPARAVLPKRRNSPRERIFFDCPGKANSPGPTVHPMSDFGRPACECTRSLDMTRRTGLRCRWCETAE